jgi:hypothetical protein
MILFKKIIVFALFFLFINPDSNIEKENDDFLVINGKPNAVIVICEEPQSSVAFAAQEFQDYIKKISGASLPIVMEKDDGESFVKEDSMEIKTTSELYPNVVYIGYSSGLDEYDITGANLEWGGYQIASGKNWLALVGGDIDFEPKGLYAKKRSDWKKNVKQQWENATNNAGWENPVGSSLWKKYNRALDLWEYDQKGSLNAVYGFLRYLGVRWFMPGELGEHIPESKSIKLPKINSINKPDYKFRKVSFMRYGNSHIQDDILWSLRQGMNNIYGFDSYHGLASVTRSKKIRNSHPEYYALYNNKRTTSAKTPEHCLSSEGLLQENLKYIRTMFDMYDLPAISVMPDDGYTRLCECDLCKGKGTPERGPNGILSDYVWEYVNKVAVEIEKSHPSKFIIGGAYSSYYLPPQKIEKLNSNVMVQVVNGRRRYDDPSGLKKYNFTKEERLDIAKKWSQLSGGKVINFMNYGGAANTPNIFAEDIKATQDYFIGEDMWVEHYKGGLAKKAFNHLNYYVSARLWWDPNRDTEELLEEYYRLFYGPGASEMRAFIDFFEKHQLYLRKIENKNLLGQCLSLFESAKERVDINSIYGKRILAFEEGVEKLKLRYNQMLVGRENVPSHKANMPSRWASELKLDGVLNEDCWKYLNGKLVDNQTGKNAKYSTRYKLGYHNKHLYVGIHSNFQPGTELISSTTKNDDKSIWDGDYIDLLIETPNHSYYQISINPAGAVTDVDRSGSWDTKWNSEIEVVSKVDSKKGIWNVEAKIPVTTSMQDPLHEMIGLPLEKGGLPWYFNVCRKQTTNGKTEYSAFSPTQSDSFLVIEKFAEMSW